MAAQRANVNLGCMSTGLVSMKREVAVLLSRILVFSKKKQIEEEVLSCMEWSGDHDHVTGRKLGGLETLLPLKKDYSGRPQRAGQWAPHPGRRTSAQ